MSNNLLNVFSSDAAEELLHRRRARENFVDYVEYVSGYKAARHSKLLCKLLDEVMTGKCKRLMVFMPPGHAKSFYISRHFPAYYLSKTNKKCVIAATHTDDFAGVWGRRVRNLFETADHQNLFPGTGISEDSRASGRWETIDGGEYNAAGVGSNIAGRRADLALIDDPIPTAEAADSKGVRDTLWDWYGSDLYPRLKGSAAVIIVSTRWSLDDLPGRLLAAEDQGGEKWKVLSLPAIAEANDELGRKEGEALWPEEYPIERLLTIKNQPATTARRWSALYQQNPVGEDGGLIKKSWFKPWKQAEMPKCDYILSSWDTAVSQRDTAAFSACTTWGVFNEPETNLPAMILLSATRGRWLYPDLRKMAQRMSFNYLDDKFERPMLKPARRAPDQILVEDRSSGSQLIQDLMRAGISVMKVNPSKHGSKDARLMLASDILENGRVYLPYAPPLFTLPFRWADEFSTELCSFPAAASRDYADTYSQAVDRVKQLGAVRNTEDPYAEDIPRQTTREAYY